MLAREPCSTIIRRTASAKRLVHLSDHFDFHKRTLGKLLDRHGRARRAHLTEGFRVLGVEGGKVRLRRVNVRAPDKGRKRGEIAATFFMT